MVPTSKHLQLREMVTDGSCYRQFSVGNNVHVRSGIQFRYYCLQVRKEVVMGALHLSFVYIISQQNYRSTLKLGLLRQQDGKIKVTKAKCCIVAYLLSR